MFPSENVLAAFFEFFMEEWNTQQALPSLSFKRGYCKDKDVDVFLYVCQFVEWDDLSKHAEKCSQK